MMILLAGCTVTPEGSQSAIPSGTDGTAAPTPEPTPMITEDMTLLDPDAATESRVVMQEDLSYYGVVQSDITFCKSDHAQNSEGMVVTLGNDGNWCQGLQFLRGEAGEVFAQAESRKYIRFWVGNPFNTKLGVMMVLYRGSAQANLPSTKAALTRCDGVKVEIETGNPSGAGEDSSVMIPAGFSGWVSFSMEDIKDDIGFKIDQADGFKLDVRPITPIAAEYYVLDDFTLTDYPAGELREHKHELPKDSPEAFMQLRQDLDSKINSYLNVTPKVTYYPNFDPAGKSNVKAITYDGASIGDKKTKVFAYIGYPSGAKEGDKYPAVVLIHGGGGHAFHDWVTAWNNRGFVAIAMDNTGFFPTANGNDWKHGLRRNKDFNEDGYTDVMQTDHFATSGREVERQWMYHAVVQAILAHNILAADPMVDASKIGITGISWGSVVTALTIGYDKYAFAIPQYCAGYLNESLTYKGDYSKNYPAYNYLWQAEDRWDNVDFPVLWLQYTKDGSATPNTNSKCYLHTKDAGAEFTLIFNWAHGHDWTKEEAYYFAKCAVDGKQAFTRAIDEPEGSAPDFKISIPEGGSVTARICYMTKPFARQEKDDSNVWYTCDATVNGDTVTGSLPAEATHYYVEFTTKVGNRSYFSATSIVYLDK